MDNIATIGFSYGFYVAITLAIAGCITLVVPRFKQDLNIYLVRMVGLAMGLDSIFCTISYILMVTNREMAVNDTIKVVFDGIISGIIILSGFSLIQRGFPAFKTWLLILLPYLIPLLIGIYTDWQYVIWLGLYVTLINLILFVCVSIKLYQYDRKLKNHLTSLEHKTSTWFVVVIIAMVIDNFLWFVLYVLNMHNLATNFIYSLFIMCFWALLVYYACMQREDLETKHDIELEDIEELMVANIGIAERDRRVKQISIKLDEFVSKNDKFYTDPELNRDKLAQHLKTNRTYLSQYFSAKGTTFYDYINKLRLEDAKLRIANTNDKIDTVAQKCGFPNVRTFNRLFKEATGYTPTGWRRLNQ